MVADIYYVETTVIQCDGNGSGSASHPRIYLNLGDDEKVNCPYCSRVFVLKNKGD